MQHFWVMKLINDSMAVKVPVTTGITEGEYVQITRPEFKASDLFLLPAIMVWAIQFMLRFLKTAANEK